MEVELTENGDPILDQFSEEGFVDCIFLISGHKVTDQGHRFHLSAAHHGAAVGLDVTVRTGIRGGFDEETELIREHVYRRGVRFRRSGPESDLLMRALAGLYGLPDRPVKMVEEFDFTVIGLFKDGEADADTDPVRLKLFGNDAEECAEADYFEAFFNLDLGAGFAAWNEKDLDYREPLVRCMTE